MLQPFITLKAKTNRMLKKRLWNTTRGRGYNYYTAKRVHLTEDVHAILAENSISYMDIPGGCTMQWDSATWCLTVFKHSVQNICMRSMGTVHDATKHNQATLAGITCPYWRNRWFAKEIHWITTCTDTHVSHV
jgi:hypothetical protein